MCRFLAVEGCGKGSTTYFYATTVVDIYGDKSNMSAAVRAVIP